MPGRGGFLPKTAIHSKFLQNLVFRARERKNESFLQKGPFRAFCKKSPFAPLDFFEIEKSRGKFDHF